MNPLMGLTQPSRDRQSATRDLAVLESMDAKQKQGQAEEMQAQQVQQALEEKMLTAADGLLDKDRTKINKKILLHQRQIMDHLDRTGGSKKDFLANGGITLMGNLKNDLLASEEFGQYKSNKSNLAKIYEAQEKDLGHLLSPKDKQSVIDYNNNPEGGPISYSGMMSEIEIPDDRFSLGTEINPVDIMDHNANMIKIMANYKTVHPDRPDPEVGENGQLTRKGLGEVAGFMREMRYGGMGSNATIFNAKIATAKKRAEYEAKTNATDPVHTFMGAITDLQHQIGDVTADQITPDYMENLMNSDKGSAFASVFGKKFTPRAQKRSGSHVRSLFNPIEGITEIADWIGQSEMGLTGGRRLSLSRADEDLMMRQEFPEMDESGQLKKFKPNGDDFRSDGTMMGDRITGHLDVDDYEGDWNVIGVSTMFKSATENGKAGESSDILLMDVYDGESVDKEATKKLNVDTKGNPITSKAELGYVIAMENDEGDLIYREIDMNSTSMVQTMSNILPNNDLAPTVKEDKQTATKRMQVKAMQAEEQLKFETAYKVLEPVFNDQGTKDEGAKFYGAGSGGQQNRNKMQQSFYMAFDNLNDLMSGGDGKVNDERVQGAIDNRAFSGSIERAGLNEDMKDYKQSAEELIFKYMQDINKGEERGSMDFRKNEMFVNKWQQVLNEL